MVEVQRKVRSLQNKTRKLCRVAPEEKGETHSERKVLVSPDPQLCGVQGED